MRQVFVTSVEADPIDISTDMGVPRRYVVGTTWVRGLILWDAPQESDPITIDWSRRGPLPPLGSIIDVELTPTSWGTT